MAKLKVGMYVNCPHTLNDGYTITLLGRVDRIDGEKVHVKFRDITQLGNYHNMYPPMATYDVDQLTRGIIADGAKIRMTGAHNYYTVLSADSESYDSHDLRYYYVETYESPNYEAIRVTEDRIDANMVDGKLDVSQILQTLEFDKPEWYIRRTTLCEADAHIKNAPCGFDNILSSKISIYPHQVDTILKALSMSPCRLLLADEVGLGKTIEACAIIKGLMAKNAKLRVLIVVPTGMDGQWSIELRNRFHIKSSIIKPPSAAPSTVPSTPGCYIVPFHALNNLEFRLRHDWDALIVDETHKILSTNRPYARLKDVSKNADNVLLLSATPVEKKSKDYKRLMELLNPKRFSEMSVEQFYSLLEKQTDIFEPLDEAFSDLSDFFAYDMKDDYIKRIESMQTVLKDPKVDYYLDKIKKSKNNEQAYSFVKMTLIYIQIEYCVDDNMIRHRKAELSNSSSIRVMKECAYEPAGIAEGFYESESMSAMMDWFSDCFAEADLDDNDSRAMIAVAQKLLQATTSSPYAVRRILEKTNENVIGALPESAQHYFHAIEKWETALNREIANIGNLRNTPEQFYSRLSQILLWIDREDPQKEKKFLVFSQYSSTATKYAEAFQRYYGRDSTRSFLRSMSTGEQFHATKDFQDNKTCRFLVCDSSGGEGRNFQMADYIIHTDLSWSPAAMEQRIGRLDRIGRSPEKNVISVVVHTNYGVENDLFRVYDEGLGVFTKSLCGIEIRLDHIQREINKAFLEDPEHGLSKIVEPISKEVAYINARVEEELYFQSVKRDDLYTARQAKELIDYFEISNSKSLGEALDYWIYAVGYRNVLHETAFFDNIDTITINLEDYDSEIRKKYEYNIPEAIEPAVLFSTFSRNSAINHEELYFIAPSNIFYDTLSENAVRRPQGAVASVHICNSGKSWEGFCLTFNISYDYGSIASEGFCSDSLSDLSKFLYSDQIRVFVSLRNMEIDNSVLAEYERILLDPKDVTAFDINSLPMESEELINCFNQALRIARNYAEEQHSNSLNLQAIADYLEDRYFRQYMQTKNPDELVREKDEYIELFLQGIKEPFLDLNSMAFLQFEE